MIDISQYGGATPFTWTKENLLEYMTKGNNPIINDPVILNAFRVVDRADFMPEESRHKAYTDSYIPIEYSEFLPSPMFVAQQMKYFKPKYGEKYLHLGTGTGYTSGILSHIAGTRGEVYSLDRVQWMWERAREVLRENYPDINNLEILFRDGEEGFPDRAPYDGILFSFIPNSIDDSLLDQLNPQGRILAPTSDHSLIVIEKDEQGQLVEERIPDINTSLLNKGKPGLA